VSSRDVALSWRPLAESDLPAVAELAGVCLAADGGQPWAASPGFVRGYYFAGAQACVGFAGGRLVCVSALRPRSAGNTGGAAAVTTGLVHPAWRRRGVGGNAFDWASSRAGHGRLQAESEALSPGAHALYLGRGLTQILAEDVMQLPASAPVPAARPPAGLALWPWDRAGPARFYAVYQAAFRDRPGFPGWSQARWVEWITGDEDFRPQTTLLATLGSTDAGFIAGAATGWITQLGVVPAARGQGIGAYLTAEAVRRLRSAGETSITLNVNINNPRAATLYGRLGFTRIGRRARYQAPA
jgi:mycothiol synthase